MTWNEFAEKAYKHFHAPREEVFFAYRFNGIGKDLKLICEYHWETLLRDLWVKALAARSCAVTVHLKNKELVSDGSVDDSTWKIDLQI
jgi:hypothetical protein